MALAHEYDYIYQASQFDDQNVTASIAIRFDPFSGAVSEIDWIRMTNFKIPYGNGTTIVYDPTIIITHDTGNVISGYEMIPIPMFAGLVMIVVVLARRKRCQP